MHQYFIKLQGLKCSGCAKLAAMDLEEVPCVEEVNIDDKGEGFIRSHEPLEAEDLNDNYLKGEYSLKELHEV